ncbi:MAG TPA: energy transducer TonB [Flavobacterium sp.]|nr:energy transducer TonB [Flavobacterium sp.]
MKKYLLLIVICFTQNTFSQIKTGEIITCCCSGQKVIYDINSVYHLSDIKIKPKFPGGIKELYRFIEDNYKIPAIVGVKGKLYMVFVVEKDGSLSNIKSLRDLKHGSSEEVIRILKIAPKWIPGEQNGKKVRVHYSIPITVSL